MLTLHSDPDPTFTGPLVLSTQVNRSHLLPMISRAAGTMTLLCASAGFGKTTTLAQAFEQFTQAGIATAWLSAKPTDNDLSQFLNCLDRIVRHLRIAQAGCDAITSLTSHKAPFALFVDELENIQEASVLALLQEIALHLPHRAYLIVATRSTPPMALSRLRVSGRLTEISASELRFDLDESKALFTTQLNAGNLSLADVEHLHGKTEGWPAALWLAAIALKRSESRMDFIDQFSGSTGTVAQYLSEVVLAEQPAAARVFLLRISVLRSFNLALCEALNQQANSREMIEQLQAQSLVLSIESKCGYWRFHGLFAEFLRDRLIKETPSLWQTLHLQASQCYEALGHAVLAIDHAVQGQAFEQAIGLLERHTESLLEQGRMRLLRHWFTSIPQGLIEARPALYTMSIWATALTEGAHVAGEQLARIDWRNSSDLVVRNHGAALYPTLLGMQDRCEEAVTAGRHALENMQAGHNFASATLLNAIAHQTLIIGDARDAQLMLDTARRLHGGKSLFNRMYSETTEGLIDLLHGRLRHASARFRLAIEATRATRNKHTHGNAWAGVLYTATTYEANDLDTTRHLINVYLPLAREVGVPDHLILIYLLKCRLAFAENDLDTALQAMTDLEYLGHSRMLPRAAAAAQLERAKMLLIQGKAAASHDELTRADDPAIWARECRQRLLAHDIHYLRLARLRWDIHFADPVAALRQINDDLDEAYASGRRHRALVLQLLKVLALHRCDNILAAHKELQEALIFAAQEGYVRTLLDEGPLLASIVAEFKHAYEARKSRDPLLSDYLRGLALAFGAVDVDEHCNTALPPSLADPLTRKEIEVLKLLTEGCSNLDLADRLHVSNSTVRTHLRNINAKLDTNSRTQAVAVARRLGLVS
ncbi:LuxR C-terminal-related transcriptional regulator [Pseudomonas sp. NPDC089392]|uniref:LuxR C-terminal-related transcriptional regulator n=1 Tax=Pseudomonas sp. NPDC089392 TaxID=3364459 RepID=UPI0037F1A509